MSNAKHFLMAAMALTLSLPLLADIQFAKDGKFTSSFIILDLDPTPTAQYAAQELADYLEKIVGTEMPFEANVGKTNKQIVVGYGPLARKAGLSLDGLTHDGFRLVTQGNTLYIYGKDRPSDRPVLTGGNALSWIHTFNARENISMFGDSGTLYGVYYFLREYLGVDWFMPGEIGEVVPRSQDIVIPDLDLTVNPDYEYRTGFKAVMNYDHDFAVWYRRVGFGAPYPVAINHSFYTMNRYQKEHPEWFALMKDGSRDFSATCQGEGNLCLSQQGLVKAFANNARAFFDANPEQEIFSVMPNDWFNETCQCEECQKQIDYDKPECGQCSNYVWGFVNKVAKEVAKTHPNRYIGCCAYSKFMLIPDRIDLEPNVAVMITKAIGWRFMELYRLRCEDYAQAWSKKTRRFYTWDYYCWDNTNPHMTGLPILFSKWLETNIRSLKGVSLGQFSELGSMGRYRYPYAAHNAITSYLTARLMWDSSLNAEDLLERYYTKFFGPAAPALRKYWTRAEEIWCNMDVVKRGPADGLNKTLYTPEVLDELKGYLREAETMVPANSVYARRIADIEKILYPYVDRVNNASAKLKSVTVSKAEQAPVIDGVRDASWNKAEKMKFVTQMDGMKPTTGTTARLLHDDDNLYILVECTEPNMKGIVAECTEKDSHNKPYIWDDDSLEIFIVPDARIEWSYIQLIVNAKGVIWDGCFHSKDYPEGKQTDYESGATVAIGNDGAGWTAEIAVPKAKLVIDGRTATKEWRMNVCRDRWQNNVDSRALERTSWCPTFEQSWGVPLRFGHVTFE